MYMYLDVFGVTLIIAIKFVMWNQCFACPITNVLYSQEVAKFLHEFKAIDILSGVIGRSKAPRVTVSQLFV